ncbi:MAG: preprotein translocase subunit YajC [Deltaproteobacteria bacterium]|nr:preprotein translocase subunit YajC [Deltaproteobacteria bacterium]
MFTELVYALAGMPGGGEGGSGSSGMLGALFPLILMFVIFYFLLIRPQQRKAKDQRLWLSSLNKGDRVVTTGGLHGQITGLTDTVVTLEIAPKIRVKVSRSAIAGSAGPEQPATSSADDKK